MNSNDAEEHRRTFVNGVGHVVQGATASESWHYFEGWRWWLVFKEEVEGGIGMEGMETRCLLCENWRTGCDRGGRSKRQNPFLASHFFSNSFTTFAGVIT